MGYNKKFQNRHFSYRIVSYNSRLIMLLKFRNISIFGSFALKHKDFLFFNNLIIHVWRLRCAEPHFWGHLAPKVGSSPPLWKKLRRRNTEIAESTPSTVLLPDKIDPKLLLKYLVVLGNSFKNVIWTFDSD